MACGDDTRPGCPRLADLVGKPVDEVRRDYQRLATAFGHVLE